MAVTGLGRQWQGLEVTAKVCRVEDAKKLLSNHFQRPDLLSDFVGARPTAPTTSDGQRYVSHITHSQEYKEMWDELVATFGSEVTALIVLHLGSDATQTVLLGDAKVGPASYRIRCDTLCDAPHELRYMYASHTLTFSARCAIIRNVLA